jgi:hypothetical protein
LPYTFTYECEVIGIGIVFVKITFFIDVIQMPNIVRKNIDKTNAKRASLKYSFLKIPMITRDESKMSEIK